MVPSFKLGEVPKFRKLGRCSRTVVPSLGRQCVARPRYHSPNVDKVSSKQDSNGGRETVIVELI